MYMDRFVNNGYVSGDFHDNYRPTSTVEKFSFSAYFRRDEACYYKHGVASLFDARDGNQGFEFWLFLLENNSIQIKTGLNGDGAFANVHNDNSDLYPRGQFHHYAFTSDGSGNVKVYLNGIQKGSWANKYFVPQVPTDGQYRIGNRNNTNLAAKVAIDGVTIYKGTHLSAADVLALANQRTTYDTNYDNNIASYLATIPVVTTADIEENSTLNGGATLVNGVYVESTNGNTEYVNGAFTDDLRPVDSREKFSFSGYWKLGADQEGTHRHVPLFEWNWSMGLSR